MDVLLGIIFFVLITFSFYFVPKFLGERFEWLKKLTLTHPIMSKLLVAALGGFAVFVLFTDKVPRMEQKAAIILASFTLIAANIYLGEKKETGG